MAQCKVSRGISFAAASLAFALAASPEPTFAQQAWTTPEPTQDAWMTLAPDPQCVAQAGRVRQRDITSARARAGLCLGVGTGANIFQALACVIASGGTMSPVCLAGLGAGEATLVIGCAGDYFLNVQDIEQNYRWAIQMCGS